MPEMTLLTSSLDRYALLCYGNGEETFVIFSVLGQHSTFLRIKEVISQTFFRRIAAISHFLSRDALFVSMCDKQGISARNSRELSAFTFRGRVLHFYALPVSPLRIILRILN